MSNHENETSEQGFVLIANEILRKCKINGEVQSLNECSDSFFVAVYEGILGEALVGVVTNAISYEQRVSNCEKVIDGLSHDVLNVDLSHITAENIVDGDINTIQNLLEIFKELLDFILDVDDEFDLEHATSFDDVQNDSNMLCSDHEVISDVLEKELGRKLSGKMSSDGSTIGEPELSSIPKCSDVPSSRNSDVDSNSTDEIIRESKLLERKLSRDYPSLHRLKDQRESERTLGLPKGKVSEDKGEWSGTHVEQDLDKVTRKITRNHEDKCSQFKRNMPSGFNGISAAMDNIPSTSVGTLRGTGRTLRDIEEPETGRSGGISETVDNVPRFSGEITRNSRVNTGTSRDTYLPKSGMFGADNLHRLSNSLRKPVVIPTEASGEVYTPRDSEGFASGGRGNSGRITVDNSGYHPRDREKDRQKSTLKSKKESRVCETKTKGVNDEGLSLGKVAPTFHKTNSNAKKRGKDAEKTVCAKSRLGDHRVNVGGRGSLRDSESIPGGKKGKENKRPLGAVSDQGGSQVDSVMEQKQVGGKKDSNVRSGMTGDSVVRRIESTEARKRHTDGSESSGVFWDDQISPLDVSERLRNPSQGLAFDEVGLAQKSRDYEARRRLGKSSRESPVVRHYHHHFHHGSSEDLVRDVDLSEKPQQIAGPGLGAIPSKKEHRNLDKSGRISRKEETVRKEKPGKRSEKPGKRSVKFDDHVDTVLITSRLERLRREMETEEGKQNERRSQIKNGYSGYLERLNKEHKRMEKELKQKPKKTKKGSPYRKKQSVVSRDRAQTNQRKARYPSTKARKRSSSSSPKIRNNKRKAAKQLEKGDIILPTLLDEFPFLHLSPHTLQTMRRKQTQQLTSLSKSAQADKQQTKTQKVIEDAEKRQQTLLKILRKDLQHNQRMREQKERTEQERLIKSKLREKRHASARARRYYEDYQLRMRARMLKRRTREEQIFKNLFEDGLEIQKQRVHELRSYAKEQREKRAVRQQNELESLENYYRDQYSIMAEAIAQEKDALLVREKAQEKVIHDMQRNLREKLRNEVTEIQETLVRDEDDAYFRRLDAERLRRQLQVTAFQNLS